MKMLVNQESSFFSRLKPRLSLVSLAAIFISAVSYAYAILALPKSFTSAVTIFFLIVVFCVLVCNLSFVFRAEERELPRTLPALLLYALALHLALILGFHLSGRAETAIWVADSYSVHLPGAINVANCINGTETLRSIGNVPFDHVFFTQLFVGFFFSFFGVSAAVTSLALMLIKIMVIFVVYLLGKIMFNRRIGLVGAMLYLFSPTVLYYTTVFYKEPAVQLSVASIMLSTLALYLNCRQWQYWILLIVSLAMVLNERFYLFFCFSVVLIPLLLFALKSYGKIYALAGLMIMVSGLYFVAGKYANHLTMTDVSYSNMLRHFYEMAHAYRASFNSYSDVAAINTALPYPFAFLKLLFTPFFTMNKFDLFSDFSYVLIWGSFFNQALIALALYGICRNLRFDWRRRWFLISPFFIFMSLFAYLAPYAGRLRDSFYPILAIYAAYAIAELVGRSPIKAFLAPRSVD